MKKPINQLLFFGLVFLVAGFSFLTIRNEISYLITDIDSIAVAVPVQKLSRAEVLHQTEGIKESDFATLFFAGDVMFDRGVKSSVNRNFSGDYRYLTRLINKETQKADAFFVNLEGAISNQGNDTGKKYSFRFDPESILALQNAGVDIVSLANNHALDWGRLALCDSVSRLREVGIQHVGAGCNSFEAEQMVENIYAGTSVGFLAFTEFDTYGKATLDKAGLSEFSRANMSNRIEELRQNGTDIVIVSIHWGQEYNNRSSVSQRELAHFLIDSGASLIIGHHPHVIQEIEKYKDGWIYYSLGNFIFDQDWSKETMLGMLGRITIGKGKIIGVDGQVVQINDKFQPFLTDEIVLPEYHGSF